MRSMLGAPCDKLAHPNAQALVGGTDKKGASAKSGWSPMAGSKQREFPMKKLAAVAFAAALMLAGCGGDSKTDAGSGGAKLSGDDKKAFDAVLAGLQKDGPEGITEAQMTCTAEKVVKSLGAKRVLEVDFSQEDVTTLTEAEATKVYDSLNGCADLSKLFVSAISEGGEISDKSADCIVKGLPKDFLKKSLIDEFTGKATSDDPPAEVFGVIAKCLSPEELKKLGG